MLTLQNTSVIYHKNCTDGFMSAFLHYYAASINASAPASQYEYIPTQYGDIPKEIKHENVLIMDFCFTPEQFANPVFNNKNIVVFDHHETSAKKFQGYGNYACLCHPKATRPAIFDFRKDLSGAGLALEQFGFIISAGLMERVKQGVISRTHAEAIYKRLQRFANAVQDRDLWKFELNGTEAIYEYLNSLPETFEGWKAGIIDIAEDELNTKLMLCQERVNMRDEISAQYARKASYFTYQDGEFALVNCPSNFASVTGSILAKKCKFAALYILDTTAKHCIVSLRSDKDSGVDVSQIAARFGGGGHVNAAGFKIDLKDNTIEQYSNLSKLLNGVFFA